MGNSVTRLGWDKLGRYEPNGGGSEPATCTGCSLATAAWHAKPSAALVRKALFTNVTRHYGVAVTDNQLSACCNERLTHIRLAQWCAAALARLSHSAVLVGVASFYTSFLRDTPLLIYLRLPRVGLVPGAISAGIIAPSLNYGAYLSEIFRAGHAGTVGVASGQCEAALAMGMRPWQTFLRIVLPQAMRAIIPPIATQFISMLKNSLVSSVMGV